MSASMHVVGIGSHYLKPVPSGYGLRESMAKPPLCGFIKTEDSLDAFRGNDVCTGIMDARL